MVAGENEDIRLSTEDTEKAPILLELKIREERDLENEILFGCFA